MSPWDGNWVWVVGGGWCANPFSCQTQLSWVKFLLCWGWVGAVTIASFQELMCLPIWLLKPISHPFQVRFDGVTSKLVNSINTKCEQDYRVESIQLGKALHLNSPESGPLVLHYVLIWPSWSHFLHHGKSKFFSQKPISLKFVSF